MPHSQETATLSGAQLRHLLRVTEATSRAPERDPLVLLLGTDPRHARDGIAPVLMEDVPLPSGGAVRPEGLLAPIVAPGVSR